MYPNWAYWDSVISPNLHCLVLFHSLLVAHDIYQQIETIRKTKIGPKHFNKLQPLGPDINLEGQTALWAKLAEIPGRFSSWHLHVKLHIWCLVQFVSELVVYDLWGFKTSHQYLHKHFKPYLLTTKRVESCKVLLSIIGDWCGAVVSSYCGEHDRYKHMATGTFNHD